MQGRNFKRIIVITIILLSFISIKTVNAQKIKLTPIDDSYVNHEKEDTNYAEDSFLKIRNDHGFANTSGWRWSSFLKFNLSNLLNNSLIHSAHLNIYYTFSEHYESFNQTLLVYRVTSSWDENTLKYSTKPSTYSQNTTNITIKDNTSSWIRCNVTKDILKIANQTVENHGWKISDENHWGHFDIPEFIFYSKDSNQSNFHPYLEINVTNIKPKVNFYYNLSLDEKKINLTDKSSDLDGNIASWNWSFGDGNSSNMQNPIHTYKDYGRYNVTLTVKDNLEGVNSTTKTILISKEEKVKKDIEGKFNITLATNFYVENISLFNKPGEVLSVKENICNQDQNGFLFTINDSLDKLFIWFEKNDYIELVDFYNNSEASINKINTNLCINISINKTSVNWSYIKIPDNYENHSTLIVKRSDNSSLPDCRIFRENNTISIIDNQTDTYMLIFTSTEENTKSLYSSHTKEKQIFSLGLILIIIMAAIGISSQMTYIYYKRKNLSYYVKKGHMKIKELDKFLENTK